MLVNKYIKATIFILGCLILFQFNLYLSEPVFFSGDGGYKYLMVNQFTKGQITPELILETDSDTDILWNSGLFPFESPFIYTHKDGILSGVPLYFPLISTPFLKIFGWRGLYIIPFVSVVLFWLLITWFFSKLKLHNLLKSAILLVIIFGTPLTIYGGIFWEHTLAVFLSSFSVILIVKKDILKSNYSILFGILSGLGIFFRPEVLIVVPIAIFSTMVSTKTILNKKVILFIFGFFLTTLFFFIFNLKLYDNILGLHSQQILNQNIDNSYYTLNLKERIIGLFISFLRHYPVIILITLSTVLILNDKTFSNKREYLISLTIVLISLLLIPIIVPNTGGSQFSPRYLLVLMPWYSILIGLLLKFATTKMNLIKITIILFSFILITKSISTNYIKGTFNLKHNYKYRVLPLFDLVKDSPKKNILITNQFIAQELAFLMTEKTFFLVKTNSDIQLIEKKFSEININSSLFISYGNEQFPESDGTYKHLGQYSYFEVRQLDF